MQGTPDLIRLKAAEVERFLHNALARKRRVAVDQQKHGVFTVRIARSVDFRTGASHGDGVDELQVAGVETERQVHLAAGSCDPIGAVAHMIFHVTAAEVQLRIDVFKLAKNVLRMLAHDVGQDIEASAVRHGHDDFVDALLTGFFNGHVEQGDQAFRAFERKAFRTGILALNKLFKNYGIGQPGKNSQLLFAADFGTVLRRLHAFLQPLAHVVVVDVHEFDTDGTTVGMLQTLNHFTQCTDIGSRYRIRGHHAIQIGLGKAVELGFKFRLRPLASRVDQCQRSCVHVSGTPAPADRRVLGRRRPQDRAVPPWLQTH